MVEFDSTRVKGPVWVADADFYGARSDRHGFDATVLNTESLLWKNVTLQNDASLNLSGAQLSFLLDEEKSWPKPGKLNITGLRYQGFGLDSPSDVPSRLRWVRLNAILNPQPYDQLAKYYRSTGANAYADAVLMARDDVLYSNGDIAHRIWGNFLKITIGYGHQPLRAITWSLVVVLMGWAVVSIGKRAGVMRPTWPETVPPSQTIPEYEHLHPLLYSFDVFLPFVNFHQEHYWWPSSERSGECRILGQKIRISGSILRYYLWLQIVAGWLLSAIFLAGVTGLIRND
jgi:hypothetical protein